MKQVVNPEPRPGSGFRPDATGPFLETNRQIATKVLRLCGALPPDGVPGINDIELVVTVGEAVLNVPGQADELLGNVQRFITEVARQIAPLYGIKDESLPPMLRSENPTSEEIPWLGDKLGDAVPWRTMLMAHANTFIGPVEIEKSDYFFNGEQWDREIYHERVSAGRPALVVNRLPAILDSILAESMIVPGEEDMQRLKAVIVRRNEDAQRLFNWMWSERMERIKAERKPEAIKVLDLHEKIEGLHQYNGRLFAFTAYSIYEIIDNGTEALTVSALGNRPHYLDAILPKQKT